MRSVVKGIELSVVDAAGRLDGYVGTASRVARKVNQSGFPKTARLISQCPNRVLYVDMLYVDPRARRSGIGRLLLQRAIGRAYKEGARSVVLTVLPTEVSMRKLVALYTSEGFEVASFEDGLPIMVKDVE